MLTSMNNLAFTWKGVVRRSSPDERQKMGSARLRGVSKAEICQPCLIVITVTKSSRVRLNIERKGL